MKRIVPLLLPGFLLLSACTLPFAASPTGQPTESTAGAQTSIVETLTAWPSSTQSSATPALPTQTGIPPSPTLTAPTSTPTRTLSPTPALPTLTPDQFVRYYF